MAYPAGQYFIDGKDLFLVFGIVIEKGIDDLLKMPTRKDSISHDWLDENGVDVDLSRVYFEPRDISLQCHIIAENAADFKTKYQSFQATLAQPELRRLEVSSLGSSYYLYYKECPSFVRVSKIADSIRSGKVACSLTITFVEKEPVIDSSNIYMVTEDNKFMIT